MVNINKERRAHIIGGGIASLSAAVFLLRDGNFLGKNIIIYEESNSEGNELGGSLDGKGSIKEGYSIRGGRMFNFETFECTWELLKEIPSIEDPKKSLFDEILEFNKRIETNAKARLIDKDGKKINVEELGLSNRNRFELIRLSFKSEKDLDGKKIEDCFSKSFFKTNFWYMWSTMFSFHSGHSAIEFKRYLNRFFHEFPRIHTLAGVKRTPYNQYDSLIAPIIRYLRARGVIFKINFKVIDLNFKNFDRKDRVVEIVYSNKQKKGKIKIEEEDLVFITNGSMTFNSKKGFNFKAPDFSQEEDFKSWELWENISKKRNYLGNPLVFMGDINKSKWESFTVTTKSPLFFKLMEDFSGNKPGTGALVTFKDSNWYFSIVLAYQPHFRNQPEDTKVFWGYGFFPNKKGNFVNKKMSECSGKEILFEVCSHLKFDKNIPFILKKSTCIPCMMPFITSQFMPRKRGDRPEVVPKSSGNFAFIGQYCEIPNDVVFTVEYSVRSAQIAVYSLLGINKKIPKIYQGKYNLRILFNGLRTLFN